MNGEQPDNSSETPIESPTAPKDESADTGSTATTDGPKLGKGLDDEDAASS